MTLARIICGIDPGLRTTGYAIVRAGSRAATATATEAGARPFNTAAGVNIDGDADAAGGSNRVGDRATAGAATPGAGSVRSIAGGFAQVVIVDAGVCRTDASLPLADRLAQLDLDMTAVLDEHRPDVVAVEKLYAHYRHPRTAIMMGHARGVILCAAARRGIPVRDLGATAVKRFLTGHGHASKPAIQRAIQVSLGLDRLPQPPDVADALAMALACIAPAR